MAENFPEKETGSTPKSSSTNRVLIIAGIVVVCLAGLCCLVIVAGFLLFQIRTRETIVPLPQILPPPPSTTVVPALPTLPPAQTTTPSLGLSADPLFGSTRLQRGFLPDPFTVDAAAGGDVDTSDFGLECGFTTLAPTYAFNYGGGASETFLRIFFTAVDGSDTTLVVYTPNQEWQCAVSSSNIWDSNPVMDFEAGPSGKYVIWVGTAVSGADIAGKLSITGSQSVTP